MREYTQALNAVKLERVFAKPFIKSLDGHKDSISCMCKHPSQLCNLVSGSYDGEVRIWNLATGACKRTILAHDGITRGIIYVPNGEQLITIGDDKTIKTWNTSLTASENEEPINTIVSKVCNVFLFL